MPFIMFTGVNQWTMKYNTKQIYTSQLILLTKKKNLH